MKIGFQGIENCYSHQVLKKYLLKQVDSRGYKSFEKVFEDLADDKIDFALLPIENSIGGCIFVNYNLFYKYGIQIHCEFQHSIEHSLYSTGKFSSIKKVISHPQALQQCKENLRLNNMIPIEFWDTAGSVDELRKLKDPSTGCIAPSGLGGKDVYEHKLKFNDLEKNITRFYLVSIKSKEKNYANILKDNLRLKNTKISGHIIAKDKVGILNEYLNFFSQRNINLTKIESVPYLGYDRDVFSYLFFIEGILPKSIYKIESEIEGFYSFGYFPILDFPNKKIPNTQTEKKLNIGIIGFGRFGQFIGNQMNKYKDGNKFNVIVTNRSDKSYEANKMNILFQSKEEFIKNEFDIIIFATSILSFEEVLHSYPKDFLLKSIVIDVLSVKEYPKKVLNEYVNGCNMINTHPMFGPDSAKYSWKDKKFVYHLENISEQFKDRSKIFLDFWKDMGCEMIEMTPEEHDMKAANSQFITHFIGRLLELCQCQNTDVDTDGYKSLLKIMDHTMNDSWDLFYALSKYNEKSIDTIEKIKYQLVNLENKLLFPDGKPVKESQTGIMYKKILKLKAEGKDVINSAIGVPSWYPKVESYSFSSNYSTSKGNIELIDNLVEYYNRNYKTNINSSNLLISCGAKPALYLVFKYLTKNGSKWLIPNPYWTSYPDMIESLGGNSIILNSSINNKFEFDLEELEDNLKTNRINGLILCNPNNPTGLCYSDDYIEKITILCKKYDKYLIVDEVYLPLTNNITSYSIASKLNYDKIIIISSFSKYWALPGWRVGWILSNEKLTNDLVKLQSCIFTCAPTSGMEIANKLLKDTLNNKDDIDLTVLDNSREILEELFINNKWKIVKNKNRSMYIFPVNENKNYDVESFIETLLENGLGVISGKAFGYENGIRITLPNNKEMLEKMILIIENCI